MKYSANTLKYTKRPLPKLPATTEPLKNTMALFLSVELGETRENPVKVKKGGDQNKKKGITLLLFLKQIRTFYVYIVKGRPTLKLKRRFCPLVRAVFI
jgi:hypothetical protein